MHPYTLYKLETVAHVVHFWKFISQALTDLSVKYNQPLYLAAVEKTLHWMVGDTERTWIGVVLDQDLQPQAFAVAYDATMPFDDKKQWAVKWFYHTPHNFAATLFLQNCFESYAKLHKIDNYLVTTNRLSGGAIRCFQSEKYGFKKAFLVFERSI